MTRCLLVGAAPSEGRGLRFVLDTLDFDVIIAVDGGYGTLLDLGFVPDAAFGDFDSLGYTPDEGIVSAFDTHKDFTDMDWALNYAFEHAFDDVVICDAFVGRLDHTLGNMQLLVQAARRGQKVWGVSDEEVIVALVGPGPFSRLSFDTGARGTLSVLSHSDVASGVREEGLEYSLGDATVINHVVWGVSNELVASPAHISLEQGSLWVLFPLSELPRAHYGVF